MASCKKKLIVEESGDASGDTDEMQPTNEKKVTFGGAAAAPDDDYDEAEDDDSSDEEKEETPVVVGSTVTLLKTITTECTGRPVPAWKERTDWKGKMVAEHGKPMGMALERWRPSLFMTTVEDLDVVRKQLEAMIKDDPEDYTDAMDVVMSMLKAMPAVTVSTKVIPTPYPESPRHNCVAVEDMDMTAVNRQTGLDETGMRMVLKCSSTATPLRYGALTFNAGAHTISGEVWVHCGTSTVTLPQFVKGLLAMVDTEPTAARTLTPNDPVVSGTFYSVRHMQLMFAGSEHDLHPTDVHSDPKPGTTCGWTEEPITMSALLTVLTAALKHGTEGGPDVYFSVQLRH